jgi:hypothetical protein
MSRRSAIQSINDISVEWSDFYQLVISHEGRVTGIEVIRIRDSNESYYQVVDLCRIAFMNHSSFLSMPDHIQKTICGLTGTPSSRYFGDMAGSGTFIQTVNQRKGQISESLDLIFKSRKRKISWKMDNNPRYEVRDQGGRLVGIAVCNVELEESQDPTVPSDRTTVDNGSEFQTRKTRKN